MKDLKILNARIPDFEADALVEADILIDGGKIVKIAAPGQVTEETKETIDAEGKIAAPGFIDMHAHEDYPEENFFTSECCLRMGVTTKIAGNCGEIYDDLDNFVKRVENGCPTNYMMLIGQSFLREKVGATDWYAPATPEQIEAMKKIGVVLDTFKPDVVHMNNINFQLTPSVIYGAKKSLYVITPYLIITDEMSNALGMAAKRGVDVRIITPGIPDKKTVYGVTRSYYAGLAQQEVRIFEYTPGFCHAKQCICDGKIASIGTSNLDYRSLYHHFENNVILHRNSAVAQVAADFVGMFPQCREVTVHYADRRRSALRIWQCILRLFAPMM